MKNRFFILVAAAIVIPFVLSACGGSDCSSADDAAADVTMVTIEMTESEPAAEVDAEGNRIFRDADGTVKSVTDSRGNDVDVDDYLESHPEAAAPVNKPDGTINSDVEDEIPVIIATIPDDVDLIELPDL